MSTNFIIKKYIISKSVRQGYFIKQKLTKNLATYLNKKS